MAPAVVHARAPRNSPGRPPSVNCHKVRVGSGTCIDGSGRPRLGRDGEEVVVAVPGLLADHREATFRSGASRTWWRARLNGYTGGPLP